jgi:BTB/POZ domain-containing protein KCTD9
MMNHHPTKAEIRESFKNIRNTPDRLQLEYDIAKEAKKLNIPVDEYRRYYELRGEISFIQWVPPNGLNPIEWGKYIWWVTFRQVPSWFRFILKNGTIFGAIITAGPIIMGVGRYFLDAPQREKQARYQAWQIINSAKLNEGSSAGRIEALQDLVKDNVSLERLDISNAQLSNIKLPNAQLNNAKLNNANLNNANLAGAKLRSANLVGAKLVFANLRGADFTGAKLHGAEIGDAKFYGAINIKPEQITTANNWQDACYDPDLLQKLKISQNPQCDEKMEN